MLRNITFNVIIAAVVLVLIGCAARVPSIPVDTRSVEPGSTVTQGGGTTFDLLGDPVRIGAPLPLTELVNTNMKTVDLAGMKGEVLLISIVPSLDTQACERQTRLLGKAAADLPEGIRAVTVSRDLPFAQSRFADATGFDDILYLSDYRTASFGRSTGLLVDGLHLLARSVMVVDADGMVRYLQVVPELSHLPDMDAAVAKARAIRAKK